MTLWSMEFTSLGFDLAKVAEKFNNFLKSKYLQKCEFFAGLPTSLRSVKTVSPDWQNMGGDNGKHGLELLVLKEFAIGKTFINNLRRLVCLK